MFVYGSGMGHFRRLGSIISVLSGGLLLSGCVAVFPPDDAAAGSAAADGQPAQQSCQQLEAAMNRMVDGRTNGPGTQDAILANLRRFQQDLAAASQQAADPALKAGLVDYSESLSRYLQVLEDSKATQQPDQQRFEATSAETKTKAKQADALCQPYLEPK